MVDLVLLLDLVLGRVVAVVVVAVAVVDVSVEVSLNPRKGPAEKAESGRGVSISMAIRPAAEPVTISWMSTELFMFLQASALSSLVTKTFFLDRPFAKNL